MASPARLACLARGGVLALIAGATLLAPAGTAAAPPDPWGDGAASGAEDADADAEDAPARRDRDVRELAALSEDRARRTEQARAQVLDAGFQPELPRYRTEERAGTAGATASPGRPGRRPGGDLAEHRRTTLELRERSEGGLSALLRFLMWGMVAVLGVLGVTWLVNELARRSDDAALPPEVDPQARLHAAAAAIIERPLGDADELARRGEFAEAIHALLLRTLQELVRSAAVRVQPAMTSREILARVPLLADARDALAGLITAVELTHFGAEPASASDYERCRQQFQLFAQALRGAGGRQPAQAVAQAAQAAHATGAVTG